MKRFVLTKSVTITGPDFWGRQSRLTLEPTKEQGWYWSADGVDILINASILAHKKNRLALVFGSHELNVYEHIGAFRMMGLDGVRIISDPWPPYDGCGKQLRLAFEKSVERDGVLLPYAPQDPAEIEDESTFLSFRARRSELTIWTVVPYERQRTFLTRYISPERNFREVSDVPAPGGGWERRAAAKLASVLLRWPHYEHLTWPDPQNNPRTEDHFRRHRVFDLLGALSVLAPPGRALVGEVTSIWGHHKQDVELVKKLAQVL